MTGTPEAVDFVRVLGSVQVVLVSGRVVDVPSVSQRRLLAVLALHPRTSVRAEWLADTAGVTPGALRTTVGRLRKALGDVVQTTPTGYRLDADVDADLFSRDVAEGAREQALTRWAGRALEEFAGEEWAASDVARLTELHAATAEDVAAAMIDASRWSEAVALLEQHVGAYPLRDRPRGLLMEALAGDGRQADALRAFQQYRRVLAEEVGTEPSNEVRAIEQRIATNWATNWASTVVDLPRPDALVPPSRLIGRSFERRILTEAVERSRTDGLQTIALSGEAGIGKTTLLAWFAHDLDGGNVLYGRCDDVAAVSLQPFRSLVGWCVTHASTALLEAHAARCGGELARIAPPLSERVSLREPTMNDDATERFLLFEAVADLLRRIAGDAGVVVLLDDMHWAEPTALALLRHLGRALADAPVLLVVSYRETEEPSDEFRAALGDLERQGDVQRIVLRGFDDADLADLVALEAGTPSTEVAARLRQDSAGNPLYATQLIRYWIESGALEQVNVAVVPPSLRDVVWSRVGALGAATSEVLMAGAVLGIEFGETELAALVDVDASVVDDALDAAIAAGLLLSTDVAAKTLRFTHALVANALYAELGPVRRRRLHERAARALARDDPPQSIVVQLARHFALAGLSAEAMSWATAAGDYAFDHLAPSEAATWYRTALDHCAAVGCADAVRADLTVRLGAALHRAGDPNAYPTLQEGAALAQRSGASAVLVGAALATDRGFLQLSTFAPQQLTILEAAVSVADPDDVGTYARLLALYAQSLIHTPRAELREEVARRALGLATASADPRLLASIASPVLYALWAPGTSAVRADVAARAIASAVVLGDPFVEFRIHIAAYTVAIELADAAAADYSLSRMRTIAADIGEPAMRWTVGIYDTFDATMAGRLDDAERMATENLELGIQIGEPDAFAVYATNFYALCSFAGRHDELFPIVEQLSKEAPTVSPLQMAYAIICEATGRVDTARAILAEVRAAGFADIPRDMFWMTTTVGCAVLIAELEDAEAAAALLPVLEPFATDVAFSGGSSQGPIAGYLGKLASLLGRHEEADAYLRAALDITVAFGWEYHRATALIALAESRLRRVGGLDDEARALLDEADAICDARGFRAWAAKVASLRAVPTSRREDETL